MLRIELHKLRRIGRSGSAISTLVAARDDDVDHLGSGARVRVQFSLVGVVLDLELGGEKAAICCGDDGRRTFGRFVLPLVLWGTGNDLWLR